MRWANSAIRLTYDRGVYMSVRETERESVLRTDLLTLSHGRSNIMQLACQSRSVLANY
jgi:hypothetical protein